MELGAVKIFVDVIKSGSFAAVARERDVDPSSISRAISALERELGVQLFQRTTRRVTVTEAGHRYFQRVAPLIEEMELARQAAAEADATPSGQLRIMAPEAFGQSAIIPLLPAFLEENPELSICLLREEADADPEHENADMAIRFASRIDTVLVGARLVDVKEHVCASPRYLLEHGQVEHPEDLAARECLCLQADQGACYWSFKDPDGDPQKIAVNGRVTASHLPALRQLALAGMGPTLAPDWLVRQDLASGALVDLFPHHKASSGDFDTAVWLTYPNGAYLPLKTKTLIAFLKEKLRPED